MWTIAKVEVPEEMRVWVSDGLAVAGVLRGGWGVATRLTIGKLGFLDIVDGVAGLLPRAVVATFDDLEISYVERVARLHLRVNRDGRFEVSVIEALDEPAWTNRPMEARERQETYQARSAPRWEPRSPPREHAHPTAAAVGQLKALPTIAASDIDALLAMIDQGFIPYRDLRAAPGRPTAQLSQLAAQLFPFCEARARNGDPHKVGVAEAARATARALATAVYDATTPGFTRLALCDHLAYCGIGEAPHPLDLATLARSLWRGGWASYRVDDEDFMGSFGLGPASSEEELRDQLERGRAALQERHGVAQRVLAAALAALPRTSVMQVPQLYGAQVEPMHLGLEHFASGFVEFAGNAGPVGAPLEQPLEQALASLLKVGATVTNKMTWRFFSSMPEALTYQHGILLILTPPPDAAVWGSRSLRHATLCGSAKARVDDRPRSRFAVRSAGTYPMLGREVTMLSLQLLGAVGEAPRGHHHHHHH